MKTVFDFINDCKGISDDFKFNFPATKTFDYEIETGGRYSEEFDEEMCGVETVSIEVPYDDVEDAIVDIICNDYFHGNQDEKVGIRRLISDFDLWDVLEEGLEDDLKDHFKEV